MVKTVYVQQAAAIWKWEYYTLQRVIKYFIDEILPQPKMFDR